MAVKPDRRLLGLKRPAPVRHGRGHDLPVRPAGGRLAIEIPQDPA